MCIDEVEELIEIMYSHSEKYSEYGALAQKEESIVEEMYEEISSMIDRYGFDISLSRLTHVLEAFH